MGKTTSFEAKVIQLFAEEDELPEIPLEVAVEEMARRAPSVPTVTMVGKPKAMMVFGPNGAGKSMLLRFLVERAHGREDGASLLLGSMDARNPTLKRFFPGTEMPRRGESPVEWLKSFLRGVLKARVSAAVDFGGEQSIVPFLEEVPDLCDVMSKSGVEPVAFYMLGWRQEDLITLHEHAAAGFRPAATALVLNEGKMMTDPKVGGNAEREFAGVRRHKVYREALGRGAVELWMPRLECPQQVDARGIGFRQAADGVGSATGALSVLNQRAVAAWLRAMDAEFRTVADASWLV